ncbi:MAG: RHS repeat-associated core domain-containing protein [Rhodanobacteraceae bacterium]
MVDANGNLTNREGGVQFLFDAPNRLSRAVIPSQGGLQPTIGGARSGGMVYDDAYNGRGERTNVQVEGTLFSTIFAYDEAGHLLGNYRTAGGGLTPGQEYIYLNGMPVAIVSGGNTYYIDSDHLGTPRKVIDPATNTEVWSWSPLGDAFGADAPNEDPDGDGTAFTLNLRFPGQYYDAESGLNYNYFRDYEPGTGRYVESDPIGLQGGNSTFIYVHQNPMVFSDPQGLIRWSGSMYSWTFGRDPWAGGHYIFTLTSPCVDGRKAEVKVTTNGNGFGGGSPVTNVGSHIEFEDNLSTLEPYVFDGIFAATSAGLAFGIGYGCARYVVGGAHSTSTCGWQGGVDAGGLQLWGRASTELIGIWDCGCRDEH